MWHRKRILLESDLSHGSKILCPDRAVSVFHMSSFQFFLGRFSSQKQVCMAGTFINLFELCYDPVHSMSSINAIRSLIALSETLMSLSPTLLAFIHAQ